MQIISRSTLIDGPGTRPGRIVLYKRDHAYDPYVVHNQIEEDGSLFQGTYTSSVAKAAAEFERRCKTNGVRDEASIREGVGA
jgi:hypothetical protein